MIHVDRGPEPLYLIQNKAQLTQALLNARAEEARAQNKQDKDAAKKKRRSCEDKYNHDSVREQLKLAFKGKCAYCESRITHVGYPHIEHFEPKQWRPDLAFEWSNLLLSCSICNGPAFKGTKFPTLAEGGPILDPCGSDKIEDHLVFQYDEKARQTNVGGKTTRGETTVELFGLNSVRRKELLEQRSKCFSRILVIFHLSRTDTDAAALWREIANQARQGEEEYAAFVRALEDGTLVFIQP